MAQWVAFLSGYQIARFMGGILFLYPILKELNVAEIVDKYCPKRTGESHGLAIAVLVLNRLTAPRPLYKVAQWMVFTILPLVVGVPAAKFNDDYLGRALVWSSGDESSTVLLASWPPVASPIDDFLGSSEEVSPSLTRYTLPKVSSRQSPISSPTRFANGLELVEARWTDETTLLTFWRVAGPLDLPPVPIVANPPPPDVYSGPRLKVFAHLLAADGTQVGGDDGLWVDPLTLRPGDYFVQVHRFELPAESPAGPYVVRLGLYDPKPGEEMRWDVLDGAGEALADHVLVSAD